MTYTLVIGLVADCNGLMLQKSVCEALRCGLSPHGEMAVQSTSTAGKINTNGCNRGKRKTERQGGRNNIHRGIDAPREIGCARSSKDKCFSHENI